MTLFLRHVSSRFGHAEWDNDNKAKENENNILIDIDFIALKSVLPIMLYYRNSTEMDK